MTSNVVTWVWLVAGLLMLSTEFFGPHLVLGFLGLGAIVVAALRAIGLIEGPMECMVVWGLSSTLLLVVLRQFLKRWIPSERSFQVTDEDVEAAGAIVDVVKQVSNSNQDGRVRFGGTTWPAVTRGEVIPAGTKARLVLRDNLVWIVEPLPEIEDSKKN